MELRPYRTLLKSASEELVINKSRFLCHGCPVETEEAALAFLKQMREEYNDATHNCYAYVIGANAGIMRYNDDGEPGGTAGLPMMEVLKTRQVTNCIVVVTRYFGGVLLGAGGLVRAYSQGTALAVDTCGVGTVYPTSRYRIALDYSLLGRAEYALKSLPILLERKDFAANVTLTIAVKSAEAEPFFRSLTTALDGKIKTDKIEEIYFPWKE